MAPNAQKMHRVGPDVTQVSSERYLPCRAGRRVAEHWPVPVLSAPRSAARESAGGRGRASEPKALHRSPRRRSSRASINDPTPHGLRGKVREGRPRRSTGTRYQSSRILSRVVAISCGSSVSITRLHDLFFCFVSAGALLHQSARSVALFPSEASRGVSVSV